MKKLKKISKFKTVSNEKLKKYDSIKDFFALRDQSPKLSDKEIFEAIRKGRK